MISFEYALGLALALLSILAGIAGWLFAREMARKDREIISLNKAHDALEKDIGTVRDRHNDLLANLPLVYARRDDMNALTTRIEAVISNIGTKLGDDIRRLSDKIDDKADKPR